MLSVDQCQRAAGAHDPRFDGVFFIGVSSTGIYCRPICPAKVSIASHRQFFVSAAAAERAGYRPCLRCRPELAPGRAPVDAVSRLAYAAALRIAAGALNGRSVADLARELQVSERHLRRALEREVGVSPIELAQTHRLLLAKRLLADTALPVIDVAFASGFQSLRRFNTAFRQHYRLTPSALRRSGQAPQRTDARPPMGERLSDTLRTLVPDDVLRLTLSYRAPLAWTELLAFLGREALPGVETIDGGRYGRTVHLDGRAGAIFAGVGAGARTASPHLDVEISLALLPVLMPLLARLRQLFDLDAEPAVIDAQLTQGGLGDLVAARPGLRSPGAIDAFEIVLGALLRGPGRRPERAGGLAARVVRALGEPIVTGHPGLDRLTPSAQTIVEVGADRLTALGVPPGRARALAAAARAFTEGRLALSPGCDVAAAHGVLRSIAGIGERLATDIVRRTLYWPDAFAAEDAELQGVAGVRGAGALRALAESWRPWRAYAAQHLELHSRDAAKPWSASAVGSTSRARARGTLLRAG